MCDFWHDRVYMDLKWSAEEQKKKQNKNKDETKEKTKKVQRF